MNETKVREHETKTRMLKKLITGVIKKDGFQTLRMEDIAKHMDVSRATMYKYFSSKEEVLEGVVAVYEDFIRELVLENSDDSEPIFGTGFQELFKQSILLVESVTDIFMRDLQAAYPELYQRLRETISERARHIIAFYQDGMTRGIFNKLDIKLLLLQDDVMLRELLTTRYLLANRISLSEVLFEYYTLKKVQLFTSEGLSHVDDTLIRPIIDYIVHKYSHALI